MMKTVIPITIILLGMISFIIEYFDDFAQTKILYATFNSEKFFEKDELDFDQKISSAGHGGRGLYLYEGYQVKNGLKNHVFGHENYIESLTLENGNIPIWFCKIKGVENILIRKNNTLPKPYSKQNFNSWLYILMWIISLKYIYKLLKTTLTA